MIALPYRTGPRGASIRAFMRCALRAAALVLAVLASYVGSAYAASSSSIPYQWNSVTVGGGGFSPNIIFSPVEQGLAYLRTDIGGLYRYDRHAQRWFPLQDGMSEGNYFGVESVAPDPRDANIVYAAVGMYRSGPAAILRSMNRGATWKVVPVSFRMGGNEDGRGLGERLAIDPQDTDIIYFGSRQDGLQRSTDRGLTWSQVGTFPGTAPAALPPPARQALGPNRARAGISFVVFDRRGPENDVPTKTIYVGVADSGPHHLFRTKDAGASWQPIVDEPRADLLPVRAQLDNDGVLFVAYSNAIGPNGVTAGAVFKLDTTRNEWQEITPPASPGPAGGFMGLSLDSRRPGTLLVATVDWWKDRDTIWRSTDSGRTWTSLRPVSEIDATATPFLRWGQRRADFGWWTAGLAIDPFDSNHVAYTTGATVYATDRLVPASDSQRTLWRPWVDGIEETAVLALASPTQGPPLLSGFGDIGGFVHEDLHISPSTMYLNPIFDNTDYLDIAGLAPNVVVRAGRPRSGTAAAAWSQDFGRTWMPLDGPGIAAPSMSAAAADGGEHRTQQTAVAVSADGSTFLAAQEIGAQRIAALTRDRCRTWTAVRGLPEYARPVADRVDARRFYALDLDHSKIFGSNDGGASFVALAGRGLPKPPRAAPGPRGHATAHLAATPDRAQDLWLTSDGELYHSTDGGRRFVRAQIDLAITALAFGKAKTDRGYPTLFAIGARGKLSAIWRSDDAGANWSRINDAEHEYGRRFRVIVGDPRVFGRVYLGTDGRGLLYGEPM
jgi:xyloglucan-specific exo-beta-1,4-glucanase